MEFLLYVADYLRTDVLSLGLFFLAAIFVVVVSMAVNAIASRVTGERELIMLELLKDFLLSAVVRVSNDNDLDLSSYEEKADQREAEGLAYIDPRMLYVLDRADDWVSKQVRFDVDFEELYSHAERVYQEYRNK